MILSNGDSDPKQGDEEHIQPPSRRGDPPRAGEVVPQQRRPSWTSSSRARRPTWAIPSRMCRTWDDFKLGALPMSERFVPLIETIWDQAGQKFTSSIGLDPDSWDVTNPKTQEAIDALTLDFCKATNETTSMDLHDAVEEVRKAVRDGLITGGQSIDALTERVNAIFDGAEKWRARRIAVTESSRAVHEAQLLQGKESGVVTGWRWLASSATLAHSVRRSRPTRSM